MPVEAPAGTLTAVREAVKALANGRGVGVFADALNGWAEVTSLSAVNNSWRTVRVVVTKGSREILLPIGQIKGIALIAEPADMDPPA